MALTTTEKVFLGIVVQPKTKRPIYVEREAGTRMTVQVLEYDNAEFSPVGEGYLDNTGSDYSVTATISGYPRAHTPSGVPTKGGGYGTCLYTGLTLLAHAEAQGHLVLKNLAGSGDGISSWERDRSGSANAWWAAAAERGLTEQVEGEVQGGEETETLEDEDVESYVSNGGLRNIKDAVRNAVSDYSEWYPTSITVTVDLERTVEGSESAIVDVYTLDSAVKHGLVVLTDFVVGASGLEWAEAPDFNDEAVKTVLLALNVAHEPPSIVAKLARIAASIGATPQEIEDMTIRNHFKVTLPEDEVKASVPAPERSRSRSATEPRAEGLPVRSTHEKREVRRALNRLEAQRARLPWDDIADLP